jgi:hypothetical protein
MQISDLLAQMGGTPAMARELGLSEQQVASGAAALLPAILGGLHKQAQAQAGAGGAGFGSLLDQLGGGSLLDQVLSPQPTPLDAGNDVLGQIFGSKEVSRTVAGHAATQTGLDSALLKKMLPMLAMLAAGWFAKQQAGGGAATAGADGGAAGGLGDLLGGLLGGGAAGGAGALGGLGGLGGLASMLDANGDGNPLDEILGMMGRR